MSLADIPAALDALRAGSPIIVVDNESRENEGDVVLAAQTATQEWLAWTIRHTSGFICAPMTNELADRLELPLMVAPTRCACSPTSTRRPQASVAPATSSRCAPSTAECAPAPATRRRPWTS
jgi:3,4-dihydroxy 2-butanone 4-phosphate synthase/GTP cyclohydrolase II